MESLVKDKLSAYKGKKVFLTGHTGFKGAWLSAWLHSLGAIVKGYALNPESDDCLYNRIESNIKIDSVIADIRDYDRLNKEIEDFRPDFIFHLAAQPLVRLSYQIPAETFDVNVTGTANLLQASSKLEGKCTIVVITTDKVYHNNETEQYYTEGDKLGGYDPYSASKAAAEIVIESFRNSFFNTKDYSTHQKALASARAGNVIGGGDFSRDRIIPDIVAALKKGEEINVRNQFAVRPWQHVLEPLAGYLILGMQLHHHPETFSGAYNFGPLPQDHLPVKALVETAISCWGNGSWKDGSDQTQPHEAGLLKLDITKAINELGWEPKLKSAEAIEWTIEWYKQEPAQLCEFTFKQIEKFQAR